MKLVHSPPACFCFLDSIWKKNILNLRHFGHLDQASVVKGELQLGDLPFPCLEDIFEKFLSDIKENIWSDALGFANVKLLARKK